MSSPHPKPPRPWPTVAVCALAFAGWLLLSTPRGDTAGHFTDQLRNMGGALTFVEKGYSVFRTPYGEAAQGVVMPCEEHTGLWDELPAAYPPLGLLLFWPFAAMERAGLLAPATNHRAEVGFFVLIALAACVAARQSARGAPWPAHAGLLLFFAPLTFGAGANGFFDVAFVLAGILGLGALARGSLGASVLFFSLSGALHFRALAFAPAALWALVRLWREVPWRRRAWVLAGAAILVLPAAAAALVLDTHAFPIHNPLRGKGVRLAVFLLLSMGAGGWLAWKRREWLAAATLGVCALLMVADPQHCWWHALVLCVPALTLLASRTADKWTWAVAWGFCLAGALLAYVDPWPPFWEWIRMTAVR